MSLREKFPPLCCSWAVTQTCRFEQTCRFSHAETKSEQNVKSKESIDVCYNFMNKGECNYGERCRFLHDGDQDIAHLSLRGERRYRDRDSRGALGNADSRGVRGRIGVFGDTGDDICFRWRDRGDCRFGEGCKFSHDDGNFGGQSMNICYNWKDTNECQFGDNCKFIHSDL